VTGSGAVRCRISWLDVFTDRPFAGNQLAVIPDADALSGEQMQALARELGISETVFALEGARRIRIFTPAAELPLAGHPTVGGAIELARLGQIPADGPWVFKTGAGNTPVRVADGVATMTQAEPELGLEHDLPAVAAALQVDGDAFASPPQMCTTTGVRQLFAEVEDRAALAALVPDQELVRGLENVDLLSAWCEVADGEVAQRGFAPQLGIAEDPATGSAAGALAALRVFRGARPGPLLVRQGEEIGRPSEMHAEVDGEPGTPTEVRVGGRAILVFEGEVEVPAL
jgi:trans-2,3-dihydro-3-hydroxyanthranilate isomerase